MKVFYISGFSYSLKVWDVSGSLERELMYFEKLYKDFKVEHSIFTYGDIDELNYVNNEYITIYPMFSMFKNRVKNYDLYIIYYLSIQSKKRFKK